MFAFDWKYAPKSGECLSQSSIDMSIFVRLLGYGVCVYTTPEGVKPAIGNWLPSTPGPG